MALRELELLNYSLTTPLHSTPRCRCCFMPTVLGAARQQIRIVQGKGRKDRYTLLSPRLLTEFPSYA